ncbi:MAG: thioredoxin domain-containing protein [Mycobacterium sp.]
MANLRRGTAKLTAALAVAVSLLGCVAPWYATQAAAAGTNAIRVTSGNVILDPSTHQPKAVLALYEDLLCPPCATFEKNYGPTIDKLIETGAIAADYYFVAILDNSSRDYSSRAGAAAYCVADQSINAFRSFRGILFANQPSESATTFPDNGQLINDAQQAGAPNAANCITSGTHLALVRGMAQAVKVSAAPTVRINGVEFDTSSTTPDDLVARIKQIVGNVPGL